MRLRERAIAQVIENNIADQMMRDVMNATAITVASTSTPKFTITDMIRHVQEVKRKMEEFGPPFTGEIHTRATIPADQIFVATICATKPRDEAIAECFSHVYAGGPKPEKPLIKVVVCDPSVERRLRDVVKEGGAK